MSRRFKGRSLGYYFLALLVVICVWQRCHALTKRTSRRRRRANWPVEPTPSRKQAIELSEQQCSFQLVGENSVADTSLHLGIGLFQHMQKFSLHNHCQCLWLHIVQAIHTETQPLDFMKRDVLECTHSIAWHAWSCLNVEPDTPDVGACELTRSFVQTAIDELSHVSEMVYPSAVNMTALNIIFPESDHLTRKGWRCLNDYLCFTEHRRFILLYVIPWTLVDVMKPYLQSRRGIRSVAVFDDESVRRAQTIFLDDLLGRFLRDIVFGMLFSIPNYIVNAGNSDILDSVPKMDHVVWLSEFGHCDEITHMRAAEYMPMNLQMSFDNVYTSAERDVLFVTSFEECAAKGRNSGLRHLWNISGSALMQKHHCGVYGGALDCYSRVVATWEILKRGYSVFNIDPDVAFFNKFPHHVYDVDFSFAVYSQYTQLNKTLADFETDSFFSSINFGTWFWSSRPRTTIAYASYYIMFMFDTQGASPQRVHGRTEHKARSMLADALQLCDDQMVFHRYLRKLNRQGFIRHVLFGAETRDESDSGTLDIRILTPSEMALATTFFRASDAERKRAFNAMHMSTYSTWKIHGMKETGLWYVEDENLNTCKSIISLDEPSFGNLTTLQEVDNVLAAVLQIVQIMNATFKLPLLDCKLVRYSDLVQDQRERCEWFFQYDYSALKANGVQFVHSTHSFSPACNAVKFLVAVSENTTSQKLSQELQSALLAHNQTLDIVLTGELHHLSKLNLGRSPALQESGRAHGCC